MIPPEIKKPGEALARKDFGTFCPRMDPRYLSEAHRCCARAFQALHDGEILKLMLFLPPRHGKTYHASERFPAWFMGRHPASQVIIASYTIDLARSASRVARSLFDDPVWPFETRLDPNSQAVDEWLTTGGGKLKAAGVGGSLPGFGADLLIIDDPLKGRKEANSELMRQTGWDWYTGGGAASAHGLAVGTSSRTDCDDALARR